MTHPVQVFFEWNTAVHVEEFEGRPAKRPYSRRELQRLFDHADDEVERIAGAGRKGWHSDTASECPRSKGDYGGHRT